MTYKYNLDGEFSSSSSFSMAGLAASSGLYTGKPFSKQWIMDGGVSGGFMELNPSGICVGPQVFFPTVLPSLPTIYSNALTNVTGNLFWQSGGVWFPLTSGASIAVSDEKVRASASDPTAGFLDAKVDSTTIQVASNVLKVRDNLYTITGTTDNNYQILTGTSGALNTLASNYSNTSGFINTFNSGYLNTSGP